MLSIILRNFKFLYGLKFVLIMVGIDYSVECFEIDVVDVKRGEV